MPNEQRTYYMQHNIGHVVTKGVVVPKEPLEPLDRFFNGIKFHPAARFEPGLPKSPWVAKQRISRDVPGVVTDPPAMERRPIDPYHHADNECDPKNHVPIQKSKRCA